MPEQLPDGWRWRAGRAGPDYWQAERLADSMVTGCGYNASYCASTARMLDVSAPVRERCAMPVLPAVGFPQDVLDAGFVPCEGHPHWLTLPGVHPGLTITGRDYAETTTRARRYLVEVKLAALERAKKSEPKKVAKARTHKGAKAQKPAPAPVAAPVPAQLGLEL